MPYYSIGGRSRLRLESRDAPHYSMAIALPLEQLLSGPECMPGLDSLYNVGALYNVGGVAPPYGYYSPTILWPYYSKALGPI